MKSRLVVSAQHASRRILVVLLLGIIVFSTGCGFFAQPGETAAEGHRNHIRTLRINNQQMMADIDRALLLDKPSKLSDKKIP
jgi:hypothetical protein